MCVRAAAGAQPGRAPMRATDLRPSASGNTASPGSGTGSGSQSEKLESGPSISRALAPAGSGAAHRSPDLRKPPPHQTGIPTHPSPAPGKSKLHAPESGAVSVPTTPPPMVRENPKKTGSRFGDAPGARYFAAAKRGTLRRQPATPPIAATTNRTGWSVARAG